MLLTGLTLADQLLLLAELLLSALLSMIIGIDRERREKAAGLRTHMLAGVGACLFTVVGSFAFSPADTSRVAAGVVSGIGFLGAGVIFHSEEENRVRDLTTAASIWATAAVGIAVGAGLWLLAVGSTVLIWVILAVLHNLEVRHHMGNRFYRQQILQEKKDTAES